MKRIILVCLLVLFTIPTWSSAAVTGPARIRYMEGDTLFRTPDSDEWLPAAINTPLEEGDAVWCPDGSRVELQLPDGTVVRLDGGSQLDLLANEDGFIHLHLASGYLYMRTDQAVKDNSLQVDADDTTVLPTARTRFRIDMLPNFEEDVAIIKGSAYVEGNGSRTRVRAGEHILLEEGRNEILALNPADNWELWNVDRDRELSRSGKANSSLPDELRGYSGELDVNGTWVSVPEYGSVWRPNVIVSADWAPYRSGRWIWRGDDYVWLSFEPWGWAPYHFGRWAVVSGFGWCWVPPVRGDVYWGPGYVGWYRTGSHVGWTPLAPGEKFYGHRNYGSNSVNITNATINTSTVVYRNRTKPGGLTVLPHNEFLRGKSATQQPARNAAVSVSVSIGSPRIKPLRETRMPIIKQTPPRVAPPRVERRDTRELRNRFPRVTPEPAADRRRPQTAPADKVPSAAPSSRTPQVREKQTTFPVVVPADRAVKPGAPPQQPASQQRDEHRQQSTRPQAAPQPVPPVPQNAPPVPGAAPQRSEKPRQTTTTPPDVHNRPAVPPGAPSSHTPQARDKQPTLPAGVPAERAATPVTPPQQPASQQRENRRQPTTRPQAAPQPVPPVPQNAPPVPGAAPQRSEQPRQTVTPPADVRNRPAATVPRGDARQATPTAPAAVPPKAVTAPRADQPRRESVPREIQPKKVWKVTTPESSPEKDPKGSETKGSEPKGNDNRGKDRKER
ncbi:MAG: FecR domain-containing protein [Desulfuromonadales bacterium]|nr:FecR domain-containing protein [Desulfuromonadales bacterium]